PQRETDSAVVRWIGSGLDEVHAFFPDRAARRVRLRPLGERTTRGPPDDRSSRPYRVELPVAADSAFTVVEAAGTAASSGADTRSAGGNRRPALLSALIDQSSAAILVFARKWRRNALAFFRSLERGFDAWACNLPSTRRA